MITIDQVVSLLITADLFLFDHHPHNYRLSSVMAVAKVRQPMSINNMSLFFFETGSQVGGQNGLELPIPETGFLSLALAVLQLAP